MLNRQTCGSFVVYGAASIKIKNIVSDVVTQEAGTLTTLAQNVPEATVALVEKIMATSGKVVFSGVGKSGLVAQKLAATFSSLGIPAIFVHACDALHGDMGKIQSMDLLIGISKSGSCAELCTLYSSVSKAKIYTVLICCNDRLSFHPADLVIKLPFSREACSMNLAPTSSTTIMCTFGDAIAVAVSTFKNFNKTDFAKNHPSGALGMRLTSTVKHFMHNFSELPFVTTNSNFNEILYTISSKRLGICIVVDVNQKLLGLITDGDLRRACNQYGPAVFDKISTDIMTTNPKTIDSATLATHALTMMEEFNITSLIVTQSTCIVGVVHIHDLIKAGIKG